MISRIHYFASIVLLILFLSLPTQAVPQLTLYLPFDGDITPQVAAGEGQPTYLKEGENPKFAEGISGQGFITGGDNEQVSLPASGYINPDSWTISFWIKGLPGASWTWNKRLTYLETFWQLQGGTGGFMWFYHWKTDSSPMLYSVTEKGKSPQFTHVPIASGEDWHQWVVTYEKGKGTYIYIDGSLFDRSSALPPRQIERIGIGQQQNAGSPKAPNKIIDEFKIYDGALDAESVTRQYWKEGKKYFYPTVSSNIASGINIDGKIGSNEWRKASGFSGMIDATEHQFENPVTWGRIAHDQTNLYVALHSDDPPGAKESTGIMAQSGYLQRNVTNHDGNVESDDHFSISLSPQGTAGKTYLLRINSADVIWDGVSSDGTNFDSNWDSNAIAKSSFDKTGWNVEIAIPLNSLGVSSIPDGDEWEVNFGRVWKQQIERQDTWAPANKGKLVFGGNLSIQPQIFTVEKNGKAHVSFSLKNNFSSEQEANIILKIEDEIVQSDNVKLVSQETKKIVLSGISESPNAKLATVTVSTGEKVLLSESRPITLSTTGKFNLWSYPSREQIRIGWDLQGSQDVKNLSLRISLQNENKTVKSWNFSDLKAARDSQLIDISKIKPALYTVKVDVLDKNEVVQQQDLTFDKKPLPDWLGNTLGVSSTPPPPWESIQVNKERDSLSISDRIYSYNQSMFPSQIINRGKNMLTAPMRLVLDQKSSDKVKTNVKWTDTNPNRATSLRTGEIGDFTLSSNSYVEFDGMNWTTLKVIPNKKGASLNSLVFEIPLDSYWAELMTLGHTSDYNLGQTGILPSKGWKGNAGTSMPWIGNGDGGIQFFQESTAKWKGSKKIEIMPDKSSGQTIIKVHFVDVETKLNEPFEISFGWITSPTRPKNKNHRNRRFLSYGALNYFKEKDNYLQKALKVNPDTKAWITWWQGWWWKAKGYEGHPDAGGSLPVPRDDLDKNLGIRNFEGIPVIYSPYFRLTNMFTTNSPWFEQFGDEWVPTDEKIKPDTEDPQDFTYVSQASPSLRDLYAWGFNRLLSETNTESIYYDLSAMRADTNIYHGAGIEMEDGSTEPTYNILGMREGMKRLYTLLKQHHPQGIVIYHMSGEPMLPFGSFSDVFLDGENLYAQLDRKENRGYEKILPIDKFRAEYSSQNNFGPEMLFLPEFERSKSVNKDEWQEIGHDHMDYLLGLILLHDSNVSWDWMDIGHTAKIYSALDATGLNGDWEFIPYWRQEYVKLPENVYASYYKSPKDDKVVTVLMNTSGKDQEISVPLTLDGNVYNSMNEIYPEGAINSENKIQVKNNSFAAVLLTDQK